ncbi:hypothetical protein CRM91_03080 [Burkholderia ambifaria]|nr:hypothetical protein [Burkholderia ambifaria]MBR8346034.1 hypothetical protein [Burkholderia ambifaria]PEH70739.1 hypothetical protein CRM91_03080 [Burkholderia ambifaria]QQC09313.1 hypothetical protein I6H84_32290 [Burkholderia ambifaria]
MGRGAAPIIVKQVNSPNPSQIRGIVEIAGAPAELIVATPSASLSTARAFSIPVARP